MVFARMAAATRQGTVPAGDTELAYFRLGEGPPLVVMPGGPRLGYAHLRPGFDLLAGGREIIYYDERGSGASPVGDPERVSTAGTLADLDALLDGLALQQVALAGHSFAAHMVALFAATRPDRVRALVLANPGPPLLPELREPFGKEMASRRPPEDVEEMQRIEGSAAYESRDPKTIERHFRLRYGPFFRDREKALRTEFGITRITAENVVEAGGRLFRDFADHDVAGKLASISCPALVVHGELDPIPVESSRFIADAIPRGELLVIPNASHYVSIEDPQVFAGAVEPFLAEHAAG
jgi:proline iminopeptidase